VKCLLQVGDVVSILEIIDSDHINFYKMILFYLVYKRKKGQKYKFYGLLIMKC